MVSAIPSLQGLTLGVKSATSGVALLPSLGSDGGCDATDFRPFPWATHAELNSHNMSSLIGRRVQIKEYTINVLSCLDVMKTGLIFKVAVLEPKNQNGVLMALQFFQGQEAIEPFTRAVKVFIKMDEHDPVPHTVSMRALGQLRVPRKPVFGCINLQPRQSDNGKAMLMTLARGSPLKTTCFNGEADKTTFKKQMAEFAECMHCKGLFHGGLTSANVYWDPDSHEATITDFGNADDVRAVATVDARNEMVRFLGKNFGDAKIRAHSLMTLAAGRSAWRTPACIGVPCMLDARTKLDLLVSGDDVGRSEIHGKREY